jgi:hypothetical protein
VDGSPSTTIFASSINPPARRRIVAGQRASQLTGKRRTSLGTRQGGAHRRRSDAIRRSHRSTDCRGAAAAGAVVAVHGVPPIGGSAGVPKSLSSGAATRWSAAWALDGHAMARGAVIGVQSAVLDGGYPVRGAARQALDELDQLVLDAVNHPESRSGDYRRRHGQRVSHDGAGDGPGEPL